MNKQYLKKLLTIAVPIMLSNVISQLQMIIDRIWNKKEQKLIISYIDKLGNRQFYQKYFHWMRR